MQGYIHHHTTFDELIPDEQSSKEDLNRNATPLLNSRNKKKKPLWIQEKYTQKSTQRKIKNQPTIQASNISYNYQSPCSEKSFYESIEHIDQNQAIGSEEEFNLNESIASTPKQSIDYNIEPVLLSNLQPSFSSQNGSCIWKKSPSRLRRQNYHLVRSIHDIQAISPKLKKNKLLIKSQNKEIKQMKWQNSQILNVEYEFSLEKLNEKAKKRSRILIQSLSSKKSIIKRKQIKTMKKINLKTGEEIEPQHIRDLRYLHDDYLYKRRQEQLYEKKIEELDRKIDFYREKIKELEIKQKLQSYDNLIRRITFLQYDIEQTKIINQEEEEYLNQDIKVLREEIKEMEASIISCNQSIRESVNLSKLFRGRRSVSLNQPSNSKTQKLKTEQTPKSRFVRHFQRLKK